MSDAWTESPAAALRAELVAAGLPVRAVVWDRRGDRDGTFAVTWSEAVTAAHPAAAGPIVAAAVERVNGG